VAGLGGAGATDCGTRCSRWPDTHENGGCATCRRSSRRGPESRWHKRVLGSLYCVLPVCHVYQCRMSRCRVPLFLGLSPCVWHATDYLGPTRAFRPAERCISTCVSSPACGTGRHRIGREGCGDAAVQHVWSGLSATQQYGCTGRSFTHDCCRVGCGHGCAWDAAVGQAWRKRRGRQPVSLPPPACLVASLSFWPVNLMYSL